MGPPTSPLSFSSRGGTSRSGSRVAAVPERRQSGTLGRRFESHDAEKAGLTPPSDAQSFTRGISPSVA
jgi:hypothetical protein